MRDVEAASGERVLERRPAQVTEEKRMHLPAQRCRPGEHERAARVPVRCTHGDVESAVLPAVHTDWVRDVAWSTTPGVNGGAVIASCAQDRKVCIWSEGGGQWNVKVIEHQAAIWSVSWSVTGGILAAAGGDNQVTLWRENAMGEWGRIGQLSEDSQVEPVS